MGFPAVVLALLASSDLTGVRYGAPPPVIAVPTLGGARIAFGRGKPVIVHFWATWCHVCLEELPRFTKLKKRYGSAIEVVTVSNERDDVAASYFRLWDIDLPLVADTAGTVFKAYGVGPLPVTVVVDGAGSAIFVQVGEMTAAALDQVLSGSTPLPRVLR